MGGEGEGKGERGVRGERGKRREKELGEVEREWERGGERENDRGRKRVIEKRGFEGISVFGH